MEITLKQVEELLEPIHTKLDAIAETQSNHTETLDWLVKQTKDWNAEITILHSRMERYEKALKFIADKLQINLHSLLN